MSRQLSNKILNKYSRLLTEPKSQGASQAMLIATGLREQDLCKPQVGVASMWYEGNPCNMHLNDLAATIKASIQSYREKIMVAFRFTTVGVSDGISMGTDGMAYSLPSRELIADSIETVCAAQFYDGLVTVPGCDKNMPGSVMAMMRLNRPSIMVYGGTIRKGCSSVSGKDLDIVDAFQSYGAFKSGQISEVERTDIVHHACPGAGACGGMYTANTMATAIETMGLSLPYSSSAPADSTLKLKECQEIGKVMYNLLEKDLKPRDIVTKKSLENAIRITMALGGSTNVVLHLIAIAKSANILLDLDDFQQLSDCTPLIADLKPSGKYRMEDLHNIGGVPAVLKYLLDKGLIHGDCITVTGKTLAENLASVKPVSTDQEIIRPLETPLKQSGHLAVLKGNLAPLGAVAKITGKEGMHFKGTALVYESEDHMVQGYENGEIKNGSVIVIRNEGPKGGPGMPEMLKPTSLIMGAGMGSDVAFITDGRFSGGSHGFIIGHVAPEAYEGGPIGLLETGDLIEIDINKREINALVSDVEFAERLKRNTVINGNRPNRNHIDNGYLKKYVRLVSNASEGCTTTD